MSETNVRRATFEAWFTKSSYKGSLERRRPSGNYAYANAALAWAAWEAASAAAQHQPLTDEQIEGAVEAYTATNIERELFYEGVRWAERQHGIGTAEEKAA